MPVPSSINDLSTTPGSNSPPGTESPSTADDYFRAHAAFIATLRDGKLGTTDPFPNGTVSAPSIRFTTESNTGFYRAGVNTVGIATAGTAAATFDASGNTNVFGRLQSSGNQSATSWTTTGQAFASSAATYTDTSTAAAGTVATRTLNSFNTPTLASTNAITVTNASSVYIHAAPTAGTNTTITNAHALQIAGGRTFMAAGSATVPALAIRDVNTGLYSSGAGTLNVTTAGTLAATFSSTGNLTTEGNLTTAGSLTIGSSTLNPSGSAPSYTCRAWVNFNGTGTVAIRASGNVSSITDNGTGDYTVNFTTAMPDANYGVSGSAGTDAASTVIAGVRTQTLAAGSVRVLAAAASALGDYAQTHVVIYR